MKTWNTISFKMEKIINFAEAKADKLIIVFIAIYTLVFSSYTIFMHYAFKTYAWDLGIFTQALWTTINLGKPLYYTIESVRNPSLNFLGAHFSPILLLIIPVYALYQSPLTLLVFQSFIIALAALPLYWIAKDTLKNNLWGLTFAAAFLLHPALHGMNCFDFHVEAFIPLFFLLTYYYFEKQQWLKGSFFSILTLSTIEFAPILVLFLGLYLLLKTFFQTPKKEVKINIKTIFFQVLLVSISIFWLFLAFSITYSINPLKAVGLPGNWDNWGTSLTEVIFNVIKNPIRVLGTIANPIEKSYYTFFIFVPIIFLPLLAPLELSLSFPWIFAALLSEYPPYYEPYFQYFGFIVGQIFVAAIHGAKRLLLTEKNSHRNHPKIERKIMALILILSLASAVAVSPIGLPALTRRKVEITSHTQALHEVLSLIPSNASVATQNDILPHLAQREQIHVLGWPMETEIDYIILDLKSSHVFYGPTPTSVSPIDALCQIMRDGKYGVAAYADGVLLLIKGYTGTYIIFKPYHECFNYEDLYTFPSTSFIKYDETSRSGKTIIHSTNHKPGVIWYGPYQWLYTGNYSVTFRVKIESENTSFTIDVFASEFDLTTNMWLPKRLCDRTLNFSDFGSLGEWRDFTLNFEIEGLKRLEFRGICEFENMHVALDYINVTQLGP
ncbi:MAG: DUF2079 domain-containing protein [Candidatus Bathyarchaeia archaeon]